MEMSHRRSVRAGATQQAVANCSHIVVSCIVIRQLTIFKVRFSYIVLASVLLSLGVPIGKVKCITLV